jgi:hypothetical protein
MRNRRLSVLLLLSSTIPLAAAQETMIFERHIQNVPGGGGSAAAVPAEGVTYGPTFNFVAAEIGFGGRVVKGKPYSAEAVTETNQTLFDGNRIHRTMKANVYRDSEGRSRREQTFSVIGHLSAADAPLQTITIDDPVAGVHYILDTKNKVARKMTAPAARLTVPPAGDQVEVVMKKHIRERLHSSVESRPGTEGDNVIFVGRGGGAPGLPGQRVTVMAASGPRQSESLGKQVIEGVEAEGTRSTFTIPAGQIGNERPIEVVSERWFSPELEMVVLDRHNDPRMGETVYRLTNIQRVDPPSTLFEVPADYRVVEGRESIIRHVKPTETK